MMKRVSIALLLIVVSIFSSAILTSSIQLNEFRKHTRIIGHRGGGGQMPENSLSAIRKGLESKCDIIEIDVQQTADSVIVVIHDRRINRTTNGKGLIKNFNFNYLNKFYLITKEKGLTTNEKIPTLEQVLELINGKSKLLIEIKYGNDYYPGIEKKILDLIQLYNAQDWCIIQSFKTDILYKINSINKNIELNKVCFGKLPLVPIWISNKIEFGKIEELDYIKGIAINQYFINKKLIKTVHKTGKYLNIWTVDNEKRFNKLIVSDVDGIITNYPELLKVKD